MVEKLKELRRRELLIGGIDQLPGLLKCALDRLSFPGEGDGQISKGFVGVLLLQDGFDFVRI